MSEYFSKPYKSHEGNIKVKLDLRNYAAKTDLKNVTYVDVSSSFASKTNLASLKIEVNKGDAEKLKTVPVDLVKTKNVVKNDVAKKNLKEKDGSYLEDKISKIDKKILDVSGLVQKTDFNAKVTEIKGKIPSIRGLLQTSIFNSKVGELENKIKTAESKPDISHLEKECRK